MSVKNERINKIKRFLRMQSFPATVTEIYEALAKRANLKVSRKTIERDMLELSEKRTVTVIFGVPSRYILNKPTEVEILLKLEEVQSILDQIDPNTELYLKLRKYI